MHTTLDKTDIKILDLLQKDASLSTAEIAERVNLSQSPCWRRINQYQREGLISRKIQVLNREKLNLDMVVFTSIQLETTSAKALDAFEEAVVKFPEVVECYTMTGTMDYMLKIIVRDIRNYEQFVRNHLAELPNIRAMHSQVSVTKIKDTTELPLDTQL